MELRDIVVTPIFIISVYIIAYFVRSKVTDSITVRYFFPALTVKIIGALAVGFIYQFYYSGGDTYAYHTHGSRIVWEAFVESPLQGVKLLFAGNDFPKDNFNVVSRIWFYGEPSSYFIVRLAAVFDLLTFSTYSATAVLFAILSFSGSWVLYITLSSFAPDRNSSFAIAILFIPSLIFWGSGILKDSVTLAMIGWSTYFIYQIFMSRKTSIFYFIGLLGCFYVLYVVKIYILLCFLPCVIVWVFFSKLSLVKSTVLRIMIAPIVLLISVTTGYLTINFIAKENRKYSLDKLAITAKVTAYDIGFYTGRSAGSGYSLGDLDGTFMGMVSKAPQAINVSLFRPYLWEISNPLMALSALESSIFFFLTLYSLSKMRLTAIPREQRGVIIFCLLFSLTFAFAVGISTYNFGTLVRYKIPLIPFYLSALILINRYSNKERNVERFALTE